ncbi:MAG: glutamine--fructose-6-phosphate aminotransferase, partial [Candidatus Nanohaloarchaea archaeon]|nr:glutamine--fructose-6-phosphate aminotransferase [Candidatus Nanohaloarchaea archaeon]
MCGIIGYVGDSEAAEILYNGLKRLEYRGYDSAGIATVSDNPGLKVVKDEGDIDELGEENDLDSLKGNIGIGHTRWSTHGGVSRANAHPHTDCSGRLAIVHNGIIENYRELKKDLKDHEFQSETDTEVIAHYFEEKLENGASMEEAMQSFMEDAKGTYAVVVLDRETRELYAIKYKSPLAIGIGKSGYFFGSDLYAFSTHTDQAIFLEDGEMAEVSEDGLEMFDSEGERISREPERFEWEENGQTKDDYDYYMDKEIHEQPETIERLKKTFKTSQKDNLDKLVERIDDKEKVIFTAAG